VKTISRSILGELLATFFLGLLALNSVIVMEKVMGFKKVLYSVGASLADIGGIVFLLQPQITVLTTPLAFLISVLLTYGRLNADSEVVVLKASGMPFRAISRPVMAMGIGCFAACALLSFYVAPAGAGKLRVMVSEVITRRVPHAIEEGIFNTAFRDVVIYVKEKPAEDMLGGIFIYDGRTPERPTFMYAGEGSVSTSSTGGYDISFTLRDGHIHLVRGHASTDISFGKYVFSFPLGLSTPARRHNELTPAELLRGSKRLRGGERTKMLLEFHRRLSLPAICLVLIFLAPPLALKAGKTGRLGGLTIGLAFFALYYAALISSENIAMTGEIPHYAGAWLPALALGAFAVRMFLKEDSR
jgi:lipopolysaccharide export system permease protein